MASIRATAKALGISEAALRGLIRRGIVTTLPGGGLDVAQAQREYRMGVRPKVDGKQNGSATLSYSQERAHRERTRGQRETIELQRLMGEVVGVAEVEREFFRLSRTARERLLLVSSRVTPLIAAMLRPEHSAAQVRALVDAEIREVCETLSTASMYTGPPKRNGARL